MDCNWSGNDAAAFAYPLLAFLHAAAELRAPLPPGWKLNDLPSSVDSPEYEYRYCPVGYFGRSGTVVADFGNGKQLLRLPQSYSSLFPLMEGKYF